MTFGVPVSLIDMRAALRERTQLDINDPRATNAILNRVLNAAMHRFQIANPNGWPWDFFEQTVTLTIGNDKVSFAVDESPLSVTKVRYAILQHPAGTWEYPLERMTRADQLERWPLDSEGGGPRAFSLSGKSTLSQTAALQISLRPAPDLAYGLTVGVQGSPPELSADTDPDPAVNDHMIGEWSDTFLDYAAFITYRMRGDIGEALAAKEAFGEAVIAMRRTARLTMGPGRSMNPVADDRELQ